MYLLIASAFTYSYGKNWETACLIDILGFSMIGVPVIGNFSTVNCWSTSLFGWLVFWTRNILIKEPEGPLSSRITYKQSEKPP